jgi:hypothetical protein
MKKVTYLNSKGQKKSLRLSAGEYLALASHKPDLEGLRKSLLDTTKRLGEVLSSSEERGKGRKPLAITLVYHEYERLTGGKVTVADSFKYGKVAENLGSLINLYAVIVGVGNTTGTVATVDEPVPYTNMLGFLLLTRRDGPNELVKAIIGRTKSLTNQDKGYAYVAERLMSMPSTGPTTKEALRVTLYNLANDRRGVNRSPYWLILALVELSEQLGVEIDDVLTSNYPNHLSFV